MAINPKRTLIIRFINFSTISAQNQNLRKNHYEELTQNPKKLENRSI
jgi:hypothetical protein